MGMESEIIIRTYLYKMLILLIVTMSTDIIWFSYYFMNWNETIDIDGPIMGTGLRKAAVILSIVSFCLKIAIGFSLWKMALEYKMFMINKVTISDDEMTNENANNDANINNFSGNNMKGKGANSKLKLFRRDTHIPKMDSFPQSEKTTIPMLNTDFLIDE